MAVFATLQSGCAGRVVLVKLKQCKRATDVCVNTQATAPESGAPPPSRRERERQSEDPAASTEHFTPVQTLRRCALLRPLDLPSRGEGAQALFFPGPEIWRHRLEKCSCLSNGSLPCCSPHPPPHPIIVHTVTRTWTCCPHHSPTSTKLCASRQRQPRQPTPCDSDAPRSFTRSRRGRDDERAAQSVRCIFAFFSPSGQASSPMDRTRRPGSAAGSC